MSQLLDSLPGSLKDARVTRVFAPPHTQKVAQQIQAWCRLTNPIDVHSLTHRSAPSHDTGLIIAVPRAEDAPRIVARLLTTIIPFAVLLPSDLAPRVADADKFDGQPDLHETYKSAVKIMFLDSDQLWIVGNIPDLHHFHRIHSQVLLHPAPLLEVFSNTLHPNLPSTIADWKNTQDTEPDFLQLLDPDTLAHCNGLSVLKDADFPSRILVPPSLCDPLTRQHHYDLQHVSHSKVLTSLSRYYFWPSMKTDVRRICEDCELCENEKGKRRLAHGLFSSDTTNKPRSCYAMDFQGQGLATSGETEALDLIDSFTKTVLLIPLPNRQATTLVPRLLDELHFHRGSPDVLHSDDAPTTHNPTGKLKPGGDFGIAPCAICLPPNISSGLSTPSASSLHTIPSPMNLSPNSRLSKWISLRLPTLHLAHRAPLLSSATRPTHRTSNPLPPSHLRTLPRPCAHPCKLSTPWLLHVNT
jgi:hypothetical protein